MLFAGNVVAPVVDVFTGGLFGAETAIMRGPAGNCVSTTATRI